MRRPFPCRVVFDGQSRIWSPSSSKWTPSVFLGHNMPRLLMAGRRLPWYIPAVSGQGYQWLLDNWNNRGGSINAGVAVTPPQVEPTIYIMCGGHTDYAGGASGPTVYARAGALANKARESGAAYVIACTTIPSTVLLDGGTIATNLYIGNLNVYGDASNYFDAQVNLMAVPELMDPTNTAWFFDGVHQYGEANAAFVAALAPYLDAAIEAITP